MPKAQELVQVFNKALLYFDYQIRRIYMNIRGEKKSWSLCIVNFYANNKNIQNRYI